MAEIASSRASSRHLTPALSEKEAIKHEDLEPFSTAHPKVNGEESIPTPPPESNQDTKEIKTRVKSEDKAEKDDYQENGEEPPSPDIKKSSSVKANAKSVSKPDTVPNATRKRGRPVKSELEGAALPAKAKRAKSTPEKKAGIKEEAQDERDTKPKDTQKSARGGRGGAGGTGGYSKEQDAYIRQLFTGSTKYSIKEVHQLYTEKFGDGKTPNSIKLRWYKLKNEGLVLTPFEETTLRSALETYETNKALTVLNEYNKQGGENVAKLTQGYVMKKIKEWEAKGDLKASEETGIADDDDQDSS